jgi:hypothetical protein
VPFRKGDPRTVEIARKAGLASKAAAEKRRAESSWEFEYARLVDEDPRATARKMFSLSNGYAWIEGFKLAQAARQARLREREVAVLAREREASTRERRLESLEGWEATYRHELEELHGEVVELERSRDDLRRAIEAEAEQAGFELADDDQGGEYAVAEAS